MPNVHSKNLPQTYLQLASNLPLFGQGKQDKDHNSGVVYGIRCEGNNCCEYYIGETEQPIKKRMYQHRRAAGEGTSSAVFNHLHSSGHTFKDENVEIICKEHIGLKEE